MIIRACGGESDMIEVPGLSMKELAEQADRFDPIVLTQDITILEELRRQLRTSQAGRALLDATLVRLALAEQFTQIGELLDQVSGNGAATTGGARAVQKKKPEVAEAQARSAVVAAMAPPAPPARPATPAPNASAEAAPAVSVPAAVSVAPQVTTTSVTLDEDEDDDLPRPGKVWDNSGPSLAELLKQQVNVTVPATAAPVPAEPDQPSEPATNVEPVAIDNLPEVWQKLLNVLAGKSAALPPLLHNAQLVGIEENQAVIRFAHRDAFHARTLDRNGKKDIVRDALCTVVGQCVGLKIDLSPPVEGEDAPAASAPVRPNPPPRVQKPVAPEPPPMPETPTIRLTSELREELRQANPLIDAMIKELGAEIVKVEPTT
jgi:DNA polymerase III gamma/tau subunit